VEILFSIKVEEEPKSVVSHKDTGYPLPPSNHPSDVNGVDLDGFLPIHQGVLRLG
jgi:hypothetical protein